MTATPRKGEGIKDFLYLAIALAGLGIWSVRDGWFPPESKLKKHPREVVVTYPMDGWVEKVLPTVGQKVGGNQPLVKLKDAALKIERDAALADYEALQTRIREGGAVADHKSELSEAAGRLARARERLDAAVIMSPLIGTVVRIAAVRDELAKEGDPAVWIRPKDSFYLFNKSLAILSFLAAAGFAIAHLRVE